MARLIAVLCVGSLIVAGWLVGLWIRSYGAEPRDQVSCGSGAGRYTVRSERGKLMVLVPPPDGAPGEREKANRSARQLSNEDVLWKVAVHLRMGHEEFEARIVRAEIDAGALQSVRELNRLNGAAVSRVLLDALEDPNRFVAAHVLLDERQGMRGRSVSRQEGAKVVVRYSGLDVGLWPVVPRRYVELDRVSSDDLFDRALSLSVVCRGEGSVLIDGAPLSMIREQWHALLDVPVVRVPYGVLVGVMLVGPGMWCWRRRRRAVAMRRGLCVRCGYDLRASNERCPECGEEIEGDER